MAGRATCYGGRSPKMNWAHYFYDEFPRELGEFAVSRTPEHYCDHCRAPRERRCLLDRRTVSSLNPKFRFAWYGATLLDQGLYRYFSETNQRWSKATGGCPLPVEPIGFGCVRVMSPGSLLRTNDAPRGWSDFLDFWVQDTIWRIREKVGVDPEAFFRAVTNDPEFATVASVSHLEQELASRAAACFQK